MYLIDTNHCSAIILGEPNVVRQVIEVGELNIATCVIVQGELTYMMENSAQREINLVRLAEFQGRYSYLSSYRGYSYHLRSTQSQFDETIWSQRENQA